MNIVNWRTCVILIVAVRFFFETHCIQSGTIWNMLH